MSANVSNIASILVYIRSTKGYFVSTLGYGYFGSTLGYIGSTLGYVRVLSHVLHLRVFRVLLGMLRVL